MSIEKLSKILKESNNIVFFGGAGVSTESNIPDFRSSNGLFSEKLNATFGISGLPLVIRKHTYISIYDCT